MTLAATLAVFAATSNSTAAWLEHRAKLVDSVLGYGVGKLPTRSTPDWIVENVAPGGVSSLIWNLSNGRFDINATVFYAPRSGDPKKPASQAFHFHHGHTNCVDCPGNSGSEKCVPGCKSPFSYANWWDLYNVSSFFHSLGYDVFIHSMPLKGVNVGPGSNATYLNTDHWHAAAAAAAATVDAAHATAARATTAAGGSCSGRSRATTRCATSSRTSFSPPTTPPSTSR